MTHDARAIPRRARWLFAAGGRRIPVPLLPKEEVAERILDQVSGLLEEKEGDGP